MMRAKELELNGKTFVISKMPLIQGDRWANRVALALCKGGVDLGGNIKGLLDIEGLTTIALKALGGVPDDTAQGLLDELMDYVKFKLPDGSTRAVVIESDIDDIASLWKIRIEAIRINLDFLAVGVTQ